MKYIAYSSPFVPPEWIAAHGFTPRRVNPPTLDVDGPVPMKQGVCPFMRSMLNHASAQTDLAGIVVTTTCDQMRRGQEMLSASSAGPVFLMNVPATWRTVAAQRRYFAELERLGRFMVRAGGSAPERGQLAAVMIEHEQSRRDLAGSDGCEPAVQGPRLAIVGGPLPGGGRGIIDVVREFGGNVVLDGTETGERCLPGSFDGRRMREDPMTELADAYFGVIPDIFRRPNSELFVWLKREIAAREAAGVILFRHVWCDLWHAEVGRLREWLNVPLLDVELDEGDAEGRCRGRVEAFLEAMQ